MSLDKKFWHLEKLDTSIFQGFTRSSFQYTKQHVARKFLISKLYKALRFSRTEYPQHNTCNSTKRGVVCWVGEIARPLYIVLWLGWASRQVTKQPIGKHQPIDFPSGHTGNNRACCNRDVPSYHVYIPTMFNGYNHGCIMTEQCYHNIIREFDTSHMFTACTSENRSRH